jgi:hypothetical protein
MNLIPEELKVQHFPCPNCGQYISSEVTECRYCSTSITNEVRDHAVSNEIRGKKDLTVAGHKKLMLGGLAAAGIGAILFLWAILATYLNGELAGGIWEFIFMIAGLSVAFVGWRRYREEKRSS